MPDCIFCPGGSTALFCSARRAAAAGGGSGLITVEPFVGVGRSEPADPVEQRLRLLLDEDDPAVRRGEEPLLDHVVEEAEELVEIALDVKQRAGLRVGAELRPGPDLEELLHRAD